MNICFNGEFFPAHKPLLTVQNSSYKWGDGLFETMKVNNGKLLLENFHFERLFTSLQLLQIDQADSFTKEILVTNIIDLCRQNNCENNARIRLAVFRREDNKTGYSIEALPLEESINLWQKEGLTIGLYPFGRKATDAFANLKSANFLLYVLAGRYAVENKLDDGLVVNIHNYLCESSKANLFLVKDESVYTPALHQGCINGVMRRKTIEVVKMLGIALYEKEIAEEDLLQSDEAFLTNSIQVVRWIKQYKDREYSFALSKKIFETIVETLL